MKKQIERLEKSLAASEKRRMDDQQSYINTLKNFEKSLDDTRDILSNLHLEKKEIIKQLNNAQLELSLERAAHVETKNELTLLEKKLINAQNQKDVINSLQEQRESLLKQINDGQNYQAEYSHQLFQLIFNSLQNIINETKDEIAAKDRGFESIEKGYVREISHLRERASQLENKNNLLLAEIDKARLTNSELKATISSLEEIICLKEDVNKQLDSTNIKVKFKEFMFIDLAGTLYQGERNSSIST